MNRPWMPLYIADYLRDTAHLRAAESGAYLHLIMAYWISGRLPNDDRQLATICKLTDREFKTMKPTLAAFFGPGWTHKRIDAELAKAKEVAESTSERARRASNKRWSKHKQSNASSITQASLSNASECTLHTTQREEDKTARSAASVENSEEAEKYAFEGGVIRLSKKHYDQWLKAYPHISLRAELTARDAWLGSDRAKDADRRNWFISTSKYLANREMELAAEIAARRDPESKHRGIPGII